MKCYVAVLLTLILCLFSPCMWHDVDKAVSVGWKIQTVVCSDAKNAL